MIESSWFVMQVYFLLNYKTQLIMRNKKLDFYVYMNDKFYLVYKLNFSYLTFYFINFVIFFIFPFPFTFFLIFLF